MRNTKIMGKTLLTEECKIYSIFIFQFAHIEQKTNNLIFDYFSTQPRKNLLI